MTDRIGSMLALEAFDATLLRHDPCDYLVVPSFVSPVALPRLVRDYPDVSGAGSINPDRARCGPAFQGLLEELRSEDVRDRFSAKFGLDLSSYRLQIGVRRFAQLSDGAIHNDSRNKVVTALIYFNDEWSSANGRLRLLRSSTNIDDCVAEIEPANGTLFCFRRSERSFHGFKPYEGERLSLQMYWVAAKRGARGGPKSGFDFLRRMKRRFKQG